MDVSQAEGSYLWDTSGKKYLDFTSGWNVANLGWNHPEIKKAVTSQVKKNSYVPGWTADPVQAKFAQKLTRVLPKKLEVCIRATGGTEANENAIQIARAFTGRKNIIGFKNTYHGHSFSMISLGQPEKNTQKIKPLNPGFVQMRPPVNLKSLKKWGEKLERRLKKEDVAALLCEPGMITGWGSSLVYNPGVMKLIRKLTKKYGTLLIIDEVGTGFSRLGKLLGIEIENITPDIITFAKGVTNGEAGLGALVTTKKIALKANPHIQIYSTFGWLPADCAAGLKTIEIHQRDQVWKQAKKMGEYIKNQLEKEVGNLNLVKSIQGIGMEIGLTLNINKEPIAKALVSSAHKKGLFLVGNKYDNIQIMPPLTISKKEVNKGLDILIDLVKKHE